MTVKKVRPVMDKKESPEKSPPLSALPLLQSVLGKLGNIHDVTIATLIPGALVDNSAANGVRPQFFGKISWLKSALKVVFLTHLLEFFLRLHKKNMF